MLYIVEQEVYMAENNSNISVEALLRRRNKKTPFATQPTSVEGRKLLVEAGSDPKVARRDLGRFATAAWRYNRRGVKIANLQKAQATTDAEIKTFAQHNEGVRGVEHDRRKFRLTVAPQRAIHWLREGLQESLGMVYPEVVGEDVHIEMTVPLGHPTSRGPLTSEMAVDVLHDSLVALNFSVEDIAKIFKHDVLPRVNEKKLNELIQTGQVALSDTAADISETWAIRTEPLI
jgi:hypothetical protein